MTNTEIYRKVIWKINQQLNGFYIPRLMIDREILDDCEIYYNIFSHDFAKAFWGNEEVDDVGRTITEAWEEKWKKSGHHVDKDEFEDDFGFDIPTKLAWIYHLEKMVVEKEPLKYLEKFL